MVGSYHWFTCMNYSCEVAQSWSNNASVVLPYLKCLLLWRLCPSFPYRIIYSFITSYNNLYSNALLDARQEFVWNISFGEIGKGRRQYRPSSRTKWILLIIHRFLLRLYSLQSFSKCCSYTSRAYASLLESQWTLGRVTGFVLLAELKGAV